MILISDSSGARQSELITVLKSRTLACSLRPLFGLDIQSTTDNNKPQETLAGRRSKAIAAKPAAPGRRQVAQKDPRARTGKHQA